MEKKKQEEENRRRNEERREAEEEERRKAAARGIVLSHGDDLAMHENTNRREDDFEDASGLECCYRTAFHWRCGGRRPPGEETEGPTQRLLRENAAAGEARHAWTKAVTVQ